MCAFGCLLTDWQWKAARSNRKFSKCWKYKGGTPDLVSGRAFPDLVVSPPILLGWSLSNDRVLMNTYSLLEIFFNYESLMRTV